MAPTPNVLPGENELHANALQAVHNESGIFALNFPAECVAVIRIYLRASGLNSIANDFKRMNEHCDRLERANSAYRLRAAEATQSLMAAIGEVERLRTDLRASETLLAALTPSENSTIQLSD
jgi:hypothetical protein